MVTGASTADLAVILVDARNGVTEQSRRHSFIASLLRVPHLILAVNKMDLVGWDEAVYQAIGEEFSGWASRLEVHDLSFVPISALQGDNVVEHSRNMPWYEGTPLLYQLEHLHIGSDRNLIDTRFPVQWVIRPMSDEWHDYRGYAGRVASGVLRAGDDVLVLPSGRQSRIARIDTLDGPLEEAFPPLSVTVVLEDDVDVARGDLIAAAADAPAPVRELSATVCWLGDAPARAGATYLLKHTTRTVRTVVDELRYRVDVNTLHRDDGASDLRLNEIGRVHLRTGAPLLVDAYRDNRVTGAFILIDEATNDTVGAGMVDG